MRVDSIMCKPTMKCTFCGPTSISPASLVISRLDRIMLSGRFCIKSVVDLGSRQSFRKDTMHEAARWACVLVSDCAAWPHIIKDG